MSAETMKAIRFRDFGGPEVLVYEDVPKPRLQRGEVLIRVHAVALNPPDWYLRENYSALPAFRPAVTLPLIPGSDVSGIVEAVAHDVQGFSLGDEVFGMIRFPSFGNSAAYAQYVAAPASDLALKPRTIGHEQAAGAAMSGLTAWQFLVELGHSSPNPLQSSPHCPVPLEGRTVLINGAAGGVGHIALQLAKWKGAHVIAVASGKHEALLRKLGADEFINYAAARPEDSVRNADLVLDTIGGQATGRFLQAIKRGGALFPVFPGFADAAEAASRGVAVSMTQVRSNGLQLAALGHLLNDGTVSIVIDSVFPLAEASRAHERAAQGHVQGKIVLHVE
jgi:NADPH:quinone reductase-like Zn-dependent oxidoreductase